MRNDINYSGLFAFIWLMIVIAFIMIRSLKK